jgi:hypothetical protein
MLFGVRKITALGTLDPEIVWDVLPRVFIAG